MIYTDSEGEDIRDPGKTESVQRFGSILRIKPDANLDGHLTKFILLHYFKHNFKNMSYS